MSIRRIAKRQRIAGLILSGLAFGFMGCEDHYPESQRKVIKLDELPDNIMAAAKKALPGTTLADTWQNRSQDGKVESYEVRGKDAKGKIREVRVGLDGAILEME